MATEKTFHGFTDHSVQKILSGETPQPLHVQRRKPIVRFTEWQRDMLEDAFNQNMYPDVESRDRLAHYLGVTESKVLVWFQNRRTRLRRNKQSERRTKRTRQLSPVPLDFCYQQKPHHSICPSYLHMPSFVHYYRPLYAELGAEKFYTSENYKMARNIPQDETRPADLLSYQ